MASSFLSFFNLRSKVDALETFLLQAKSTAFSGFFIQSSSRKSGEGTSEERIQHLHKLHPFSINVDVRRQVLEESFTVLLDCSPAVRNASRPIITVDIGRFFPSGAESKILQTEVLIPNRNCEGDRKMIRKMVHLLSRTWDIMDVRDAPVQFTVPFPAGGRSNTSVGASKRLKAFENDTFGGSFVGITSKQSFDILGFSHFNKKNSCIRRPTSACGEPASWSSP